MPSGWTFRASATVSKTRSCCSSDSGERGKKAAPLSSPLGGALRLTVHALVVVVHQVVPQWVQVGGGSASVYLSSLRPTPDKPVGE